MSSVSFIVPVYNKEKYLPFVIESLKNQEGNFDREFIFVDDGSKDNSLKVIERLTKNFQNCKIISQKNKGSASATNVGIRLAKKKYIKFLDADDVIISSTTSILLDILEKNKNAVISYGLQRKVGDISKVDIFQKVKITESNTIEEPTKLAMTNSMFNPSQFLARTSACKEVNGCDERIKHSQEYSLTLRLSLKGSFIKFNDYLAILPFNAPGQISEKKNNQIYRVSKALELFLIDNKGLDTKLQKYAQRRLTGRAWRFAKRNLGVGFLSTWFLIYLKGLIGFKRDIIKACKKANEIYEPFLD